MLLKDIIEEILLELDIRGASKETIKSYRNYLKIKGIHTKGFVKFNKDNKLKHFREKLYFFRYAYLFKTEVST